MKVPPAKPGGGIGKLLFIDLLLLFRPEPAALAIQHGLR